jgi:beta-lactamase regulating signal transducer with metallopeptidase domain
MGLGTSLFLIAIGAILRFAVSVSTHGFNIHTIGTILIVVGVVGLIISLLYMFAWNDRRRTSVPADTVPGDRVPRQRL